MKKIKREGVPPDAELVFDGIRCHVYQWNQKMYDNSVARFERIIFASGAFVVPILPNGNILLTKQEQPGRGEFFSLPGGGIDEVDESSLSAAQRELREETGSVAPFWKKWLHFTGTANIITAVDYFIAHDVEKISEIVPDGGEKITLFEVTFDEFLALSSNKKFHHHWNLLPILYEARLYPEKYRALKEFFYKK